MENINNTYGNTGRHLNVILLYTVNITFNIIIDIIHLINASIKNVTSNTTPQNGNALFDTFRPSNVGWINGDTDIAEDITYNFIHQDYNTLLENSYTKISWVEIINNTMVIVSVVILEAYGLLTCLMILIIINSSDNSNKTVISDACEYLMTNIISLSQINIVTQTLYAVFGLELDDDRSNDILADVLIISEIENIIHTQVELVIDYISVVERIIYNATEVVCVLSILVEIIEVSIESKLIDGMYTYYYDSSFITHIVVTDDIIFGLQQGVVSRNSTYLLDEEVGQLIFDKIENIVHMCIYGNNSTSVSITNGQLILDITSFIAQLLINDSILGTLYKVQTEANKIASNDYENMFANDTLNLSNEYIKQQRELVLNTNISSSSSDTNNVFLDYMSSVMISNSDLYAFLTLLIMINIKIIDNSSNSKDDISFEYLLCQEFWCKDCFVSMIENKILKGMKESKFFEMNMFNTFSTYNIAHIEF